MTVVHVNMTTVQTSMTVVHVSMKTVQMSMTTIQVSMVIVQMSMTMVRGTGVHTFLTPKHYFHALSCECQVHVLLLPR